MEASVISRSGGAVRRPRRSLRFTREEELVRLVRCGDESAFEAIFDRHHRGILSFCRHMLGSREEAEDAVQHTFTAAYRDLSGSDKPIQLKAWLYTIARNRCLSILRARKEQVSIEDAEPATEGLAAEVQRRQDLRDMLADLARLPEDQRAALVLAELGALSHDEIGVTLGVRKDKVKALVFQARESLASSKQAREADCREIQEQLAVLSGGALRRTQIRRHVEVCAACAAFKAEVKRQRTAMAAILPVMPSAALKSSVLAAVFGGGAAGGGAIFGGGAAAGGGLFAAAGAKGLAAKVLAVAVVAGGATGGGLMAVDELSTAPADSSPNAIAGTPDEGGSVKLIATLRDRAKRAAMQRAADRGPASAGATAGTPSTTASTDRPSTSSSGAKRTDRPRSGDRDRTRPRSGEPRDRLTPAGRPSAGALGGAPATGSGSGSTPQQAPATVSGGGSAPDSAPATTSTGGGDRSAKQKKDKGPKHETPRRGSVGNSPAIPPGQQKRNGPKSKPRHVTPPPAAPAPAPAPAPSDDRHGKDHGNGNGKGHDPAHNPGNGNGNGGSGNGNGNGADKAKEKGEKLVNEIVPVAEDALAPVLEPLPDAPPPMLPADVLAALAALDALMPSRPFVQD